MPASHLFVRVVDQLSGNVSPDLARRVDLFRHWDLDRMKQGSRFSPLLPSEIPRRLVRDGVEFEIGQETAWLCRIDMFDRPPDHNLGAQWLILEPGDRLEMDLLLEKQTPGPRRFQETEQEHVRLLMRDMETRRTYGGVHFRFLRSRAQRSSPPWGVVIHLKSAGVANPAIDDYIREELWPSHGGEEAEEKTLIPLPPGVKHLTVTDARSEAWSGEIVVSPGEITEVDVALEPAQGNLEIRVVDSREVPIPGAVLGVLATDPGYSLDPDNLTLQLAGGFTDADGVLKVSAIPSMVRRVSVLATAPGFRKQQSREEIRDGSVRIRLLPRDDSGFVGGCVMDTQRRPIAGASLMALPGGQFKTGDWTEQSCGTTDEEGRFRLAKIDPSWNQNLHVTCQGYQGQLLSVPVNTLECAVMLRPDLP